jgi:thymidylate kinase
LRDALDRPVISLPCYADLPGANALPPPQAEEIDAQLRYLDFYLDLDRERRESASEASADAVVIADRSWLSLLAHVYAVEQEGGPAAYTAARRRVAQRAEELLQPDLVLFLALRSERRRRRIDPLEEGQWFTSETLNEHINAFFAREAQVLVPGVIHTLDANPEAQVVRAAARGAIEKRLLGGRHE